MRYVFGARVKDIKFEIPDRIIAKCSFCGEDTAFVAAFSKYALLCGCKPVCQKCDYKALDKISP